MSDLLSSSVAVPVMVLPSGVKMYCANAVMYAMYAHMRISIVHLSSQERKEKAAMRS